VYVLQLDCLLVICGIISESDMTSVAVNQPLLTLPRNVIWEWVI